MESSGHGSTLVKVLKYFAHGFLFSVVFTVFAVVGVVILYFLMIMELFIGLIIGIGLLILFLGFTNAWITDLIWGTSTSKSIVSLLLHGIVLFVVLLIVNTVPTAIVLMVFHAGPAGIVVSSLILSVITGYCGRFVATFWEEDKDEE